MSPETLPLDLMMFAALVGGILLGFPVAFTIAGVAVVFAFLGAATGIMDLSLLGALGQRVFGVLTNEVLIAIPLFVLMGVVLERSRIAEELLESMARLAGRLPGGLGVSVVLVGALLAASTGIVGATVIAMGLIALPTMLRAGYDRAFASGIVCTAGTLGQIIPPSTLLIILADVMSNGYQQAQYEQGKFSVETISVGEVFAAALLPGLVLVGLYLLYVLARAALRPEDAPRPGEGRSRRASSSAASLPERAAGSIGVATPVDATAPRGALGPNEATGSNDIAATRERAVTNPPSALGAVLPPVLLIVAVLGSILGGVATPTEAASIGAIGAVLMAARRQGLSDALVIGGGVALLALAVAAGIAPVRLQRSDAGVLDWTLGALYIALALAGLGVVVLALRALARRGVLGGSVTSTMTVTSMIFATIIAASVFSLVFVGLGGEARVARVLAAMPGGANGALLFCLALVFVLGFFLDFVEITVILLPLIVPGLILMGHDPLWLSILIAMNLQTSFLTPPFGFSLFYLRGAAPPEVSTADIYRGVAPFIALQLVGIAILWWAPGIARWLPAQVFG